MSKPTAAFYDKIAGLLERKDLDPRARKFLLKVKASRARKLRIPKPLTYAGYDGIPLATEDMSKVQPKVQPTNQQGNRYQRTSFHLQQKYKKEQALKATSSKETKKEPDLPSTGPLIANCEPPSTSKSGPYQTTSSRRPPIYDGFIRPISDDKDDTAGSSKDCQSWEGKDGVYMTNVGAFYDPNPFEEITMMNRKSTRRIERSFPRTALKVNGLYYVRIGKIVDPMNFFMEFVTKPPKNGGSWDENFQRFYSEPGVAEKYALRTMRPYGGQMYAYYNEEKKIWERIRAHVVYPRLQFCLAVHMDHVTTSRIPFNALYELHPHFGNWPKYTINGGLKDIRPADFVPREVEDRTYFPFSQDSINFFKEYTKDKLFRAYIIEKSYDRIDRNPHHSDEDRYVSVNVYLFEVGAKHQIPVNAWMVQKGYATPVKSLLTCLELMQVMHRLNVRVETPKRTDADADDGQNEQ